MGIEDDSGEHEIIPASLTSGLIMARDGEIDRGVAFPASITSPGPDVYPPSRREVIAAQAMAGILARVDGKLPIQTGDIDRFVAGAASLAVKAADALIKELRNQELSRNNQSESP